MNIRMATWWDDTGNVRQGKSEKTFPSDTFFLIKSHTDWRGIEPEFSRWKADEFEREVWQVKRYC